MNDLFLTAVFSLIFGVLYLALIVRVILQRRSKRVAFGDGEDKLLRGAIRAQVNAGEQLPLFLIVFALCEWRDAATPWLVGVGLIFLAGRLVNAYGMSFLSLRFRVYGTALNLVALISILGTLALTLF